MFVYLLETKNLEGTSKTANREEERWRQVKKKQTGKGTGNGGGEGDNDGEKLMESRCDCVCVSSTEFWFLQSHSTINWKTHLECYTGLFYHFMPSKFYF